MSFFENVSLFRALADGNRVEVMGAVRMINEGLVRGSMWDGYNNLFLLNLYSGPEAITKAFLRQDPRCASLVCPVSGGALHRCPSPEHVRLLVGYPVATAAVNNRGMTAVESSEIAPKAKVAMLKEFPELKLPRGGGDIPEIWAIHFRMAMCSVVSTDITRHYF
jgi:hypothetical protein